MTADLLHDPAEDAPARTRVDGERVVGSLSPSRASDFMSCPLRYRFRVIDRLPEDPSPAAVRGTVVHAVLDSLFDLPAGQRTADQARAMVGPHWDLLLASEPELAALFEGDDAADVTAWLSQCRSLLTTYFALEDPQRLEPTDRELYVEHLLDSRLLLRGYVDRVDVNADGMVRIVDYKTGRSPGESFEGTALFQLKFYALVLWRSTGRVPDLLQLVYLGNGEVLRYQPDEQDLVATERKVNALWSAIERAAQSGRWLPRQSALCGWCDHRALCPVWGGTTPPLPVTGG
ncbi:MAG: PD-(D/E)XK nuclease family protein [Nocardioidaceae bacterium]|nr:PD-(D/E)XK nuclease family protein [Nocardioidaceae bacterium]